LFFSLVNVLNIGCYLTARPQSASYHDLFHVIVLPLIVTFLLIVAYPFLML
jgi:hypothetical protein